MKLFRIILIWLILAAGPGLGAESLYAVFHLDDCTSSEKITSRELTAVIGDSSSARFKPELRLTAWGGECIFMLDLKTDTNVNIDSISTSVLNEANRIDIIQSNYISHSIYKRSDGNLEWEMKLNAIPDTNVFDFKIETEGLLFFHQSTLTQAEITGGAYRPDSVVGSYAVYHASKKDNHRIINGKDTTYHNYKTGKAFHIYRPKAWDIKDTVWCDLYIDNSFGILTMTIPRKFLSNANYPVTIGPTFGDSDIGASSQYAGIDSRQYCNKYTMGASAGTADSLVVYIDEDLSTSEVRGVIYTDNSGCGDLLDTNTTATTYTTSANQDEWVQLALTGASLSASTDYWLHPFITSGLLNIRYDDGSHDYEGSYKPGWVPDPCANASWSGNDRDYSVYVKYTVSGEEEAPTRRRRILLGTSQ